MSTRRGFLGSILAACAAPAIVKAEILMPVRQLILPPAARTNTLITCDMIVREALKVLNDTLVFSDVVNENWDASLWVPDKRIRVVPPRRYLK